LNIGSTITIGAIAGINFVIDKKLPRGPVQAKLGTLVLPIEPVSLGRYGDAAAFLHGGVEKMLGVIAAFREGRSCACHGVQRPGHTERFSDLLRFLCQDDENFNDRRDMA